MSGKKKLCIFKNVGVKYHGPLSAESAKMYFHLSFDKGMTIHWESHFIPFDDIPYKYGLAGCKTSAEQLLPILDSLLVLTNVPFPSEQYVKSLLVILCT